MRLLRSVLVLLLVCFTQPARADVVQATLPSGIPVTADFHAGDIKKPVILLIHGFLQTRDHSTVSRLGQGLADLGYSVLLPTLSLGIPNRASSLPCEAIHQHTMQGDVAEIGFWVNWLKAKGYGNIVLAGHSSGALQALIYASQKPDRAVHRLLLISLPDPLRNMTPAAQGSTAITEDVVRQHIARGETGITTQPMWFCGKYSTPWPAYLSYIEWSRTRTIAALAQDRIPVGLLVGANDSLINSDWLALLQKTRHRVITIKDANHFFEDASEFDLLEATLNLLRS